jgi:sortase A
MSTDATTGVPSQPDVAPPHPDYAPLGPVRRGVRETGLALITLGIIVFLFVGYQLFGTTLTEEHNQSRLRASFDQALAAHAATSTPAATSGSGATSKASNPGTTGTKGTTGSGSDSPTVGGSDSPTVGGGGVNPSVPVGTAIDHLVIPKIGVDKFVVQGTAEADLAQGPGHYPSTVMPGQVGNAGIAGHRTTYGAPFFRLNELAIGDPIYITDTTGTRYTYTVASMQVVSPSDVAVLDPSTTAELTLTTCNPRFSATSRLIVVANLTATLKNATASNAGTTNSTGQTSTGTKNTATKDTAGTKTATTTPTGSTTGSGSKTAAGTKTATIADATSLAGGTSSALGPAIGYGAGVVALWVLVRLGINRTRRWRRAGVFVVGVGVCLIPLWFCFENVVRVLPSSL